MLYQYNRTVKEKNMSNKNELFNEINNPDTKQDKKLELMGKALKEGIKEVLDSEKFAEWCKRQSRIYSNRYSFRNAVMTLMQKPDASYTCGYETWKYYGRQVKKGAKSIKIFAPLYAKDFNGRGSLFNYIKKTNNQKFEKNANLEYASYRLGKSNIYFNLYKNGLWDVNINSKTIMAHVTDDDVKKFIDRSVIGKIPTYYKVVPVFDISDTTDKVDELWVNPNECKKSELILDDNGNPIKDKNGKVKIKNSDERKAAFSEIENSIIKVPDADQKKMELLYDVLKVVSAKKNVPIYEKSRDDDNTLNAGALGYFKHVPGSDKDKKIVIDNSLSVTNKCSVVLHEMGHSDLHVDLDDLKNKMNLTDEEVISRQVKEIQAEATAYMTASCFGIETAHKSFDYIAKWSDGRGLNSLEKSLELIYNESKKLLRDIEKELLNRGYDMSLEPFQEKVQENEDLLKEIVSNYKADYLKLNDLNKETMERLSKDIKNPENDIIKGLIEKQIALTETIDKKLKTIDQNVEKLAKLNSFDEQFDMTKNIDSLFKQVWDFEENYNKIAKERVNEMIPIVKESVKGIYEYYPLKACRDLCKFYPEMAKLDEMQIKYIASSEYIKKLSPLLEKDTDEFVKISIERAEAFRNAVSKNNTVVEIISSEKWGDTPIIKDGSISHPKAINKIIADKEKNIRQLKKIAEKKDDYYPYSKCKLAVYHVDEKNTALLRAVTRVDIGDGEQKDLNDHLKQCTKNQEIIQGFDKSTRERVEPYMYEPTYTVDELNNYNNVDDMQYVAENTSESMDYWKSKVKSDISEDNLQDRENQEIDHIKEQSNTNEER